MNRIHILMIVVLLAGVTYAYSSCVGGPPREPFTIAWNYDTNGFLETCGCSARQLGGLARRATMIERLRSQQPLLAIEGAHFIADSGEFQYFKGETIVAILNLMDYDALQLGIREAQHGPAALEQLAQEASCPCFATNLEVNGAPWAVDHVLLTIANNRVGIVGISQPEAVSFELPDGVTFTDPRAALNRTLPQLHKNADMVVVCLEGERTWIREMVEAYTDQADLFLAGNRNKTTANVEFNASPPALNNWDQGRFLGVISVDPLPGKYQITAKSLALDDEIEDAPVVKAYLDNTYRPQLKDRFFGMMKTDLEQIYLPPMVCEPCHYDQFRAYTASDHSHALDTLLKQNQLYNPDCMPCHVVYDAAQDELHAMNCVICHSNITEQHLWDALDDKVVVPETPVAYHNYEYCAQCHNEVQSTNFKDHWPQFVNAIYHGGDRSAADAAAQEMGLDIAAEPPE